MAGNNLPKHDHSSTGTGGQKMGDIKPDRVDAEEDVTVPVRSTTGSVVGLITGQDVTATSVTTNLPAETAGVDIVNIGVDLQDVLILQSDVYPDGSADSRDGNVFAGISGYEQDDNSADVILEYANDAATSVDVRIKLYYSDPL